MGRDSALDMYLSSSEAGQRHDQTGWVEAVTAPSGFVDTRADVICSWLTYCLTHCKLNAALLGLDNCCGACSKSPP